MNNDSGEGSTVEPQNWRMQTTRWSLVLEAASDDSPQAFTALNRLCRLYWYPVYAHVRRQGRAPEDAADITQEFFARLLQKGYLKLANRERGRFRTFLLSSLVNFLTNEWEKSRALKRGAGLTIPLVMTEDGEEKYRREPLDGSSPDRVYERRWATALLETVLNRLRNEYAAAQKEELFDALKSVVWGDGPEDGYQSLALTLKMSEGSLRVAAHRMRERYRTLLREEVAQTVASPEDIDDELRHLVSVLRG